MTPTDTNFSPEMLLSDLSWLAYIPLAIIVIFALVEAIKGYSQGISRMVIRAVTLIASAIVSMIGTGHVYNKVMGMLASMTAEDLYTFCSANLPGIDCSMILNFETTTIMYLVAIPMALVVLPLVFTIVFIVLFGVCKFLHMILCGIFGLSKLNNNFFTRVLGFLLGAVQGVVLAALLLLPVIGLGTAATATVAKLNENTPEDETTIMITEGYNAYVAPVVESPVFTTLGSFGINQLYTELATVPLEGEDTDMTQLLPDAADIYIDISALYGFDWKYPTAENKVIINDLVGVLEHNPYFSKISVNLVNGIANAQLSGHLPIEIPAPFDTLINSAAEILVKADTEALYDDVYTVIDVYYIVADAGVLAALEVSSDDMLNALIKTDENGVTVVSRVINTLDANPGTKPLVTMLTKLSLSVMSNQLGVSEETIEVYTNVREGLNETVKITKEDKTEEEYVAAVSDSINGTLTKNGITLEKDIVDGIAQHISDNYEEYSQYQESGIDEATMNSIILNYYDSYLASLNGEGDTETPEIPGDIEIPDGIVIPGVPGNTDGQ